MDENDFEGTLVLEQMASINKLDEFFEAIDSDDTQEAVRLMKKAQVDAQTIAIVLRKIREADDKH
ncbi:hypothetical protein [Bdellovibrio bacteriovorus]|uniref:hypothetical protein n=1 Tax=Bdellovibrio bacteriovorus TaxID=959 RepID=UPI0035A66DF8